MKAWVVVLLLVALQSSQWRPEDRVLVTDFSHVIAVAASPFLLYAATPRGLVIYDRAARRWELPVTALDGYPRGVRVALADRAGEAVWLGTVDGWARYDPRIRMWQSGPVAGGVSDLAQVEADPAGGIYLRGASGWAFLPRGGLIPLSNRAPPPGALRPLDPQAAFARAPQADALRALILTDPRLRTYQFTSAASTPDQTEIFLGTTGLGVVRLDGFGARWEALAYGLRASRATGLAPAADGVWVGAGDGLTFLSADLSQTRWIAGEGSRGLGFRQTGRLLARGDSLWIVTEQGVARVDRASGRSDIIRMDDPLVLASHKDGVWVGTARRGVVWISESGQIAMTPNDESTVLSLLPIGEGLWIGTTAGLVRYAPPSPDHVIPRELDSVPELRTAPIVALAHVHDTIVAATPDQLAWRAPNGRWTMIRPRADVGRIRAMAADRDGVWVGGDLGVAFWRIGAGTFQAMRVPLALPAGVRDLLAAPPYLWVATDSGVVRLAREAVIHR